MLGFVLSVRIRSFIVRKIIIIFVFRVWILSFLVIFELGVG